MKDPTTNRNPTRPDGRIYRKRAAFNFCLEEWSLALRSREHRRRRHAGTPIVDIGGAVAEKLEGPVEER
jgi:hypothetical protein